MSISERQVRQHNTSYEKWGDDWISLRDPFTGEDFLPDRPPRSLEMQPGLREGLNYLRNNPDIHITIFGDNHGDADETNAREAQTVLGTCDSVFLEGYGVQQEEQDLFWNVCEAGKGMEVSKDVIDRLGQYKMRQLKILASCRKPVMFPEIPAGGTPYERDLLDFNLIFDELRPRALAGDEGFALATEINLAVGVVMREWYMLAKMGLFMQMYEKVSGDKLTHPMIWIGSEHLVSMPSKIAGLGLSTITHSAQQSVRNTPARSVYGDYERTNGSLPVMEAARDGLARLIKT